MQDYGFSFWISIIFAVSLLVCAVGYIISSFVANLRDNFTSHEDQKVISQAGKVGVGTHGIFVRQPDICQHQKDYNDWMALYGGDQTVHITPDTSAFQNERARVEAEWATKLHEWDSNGPVGWNGE